METVSLIFRDIIHKNWNVQRDAGSFKVIRLHDDGLFEPGIVRVENLEDEYWKAIHGSLSHKKGLDLSIYGKGCFGIPRKNIDFMNFVSKVIFAVKASVPTWPFRQVIVPMKALAFH